MGQRSARRCRLRGASLLLAGATLVGAACRCWTFSAISSAVSGQIRATNGVGSPAARWDGSSQQGGPAGKTAETCLRMGVVSAVALAAFCRSPLAGRRRGTGIARSAMETPFTSADGKFDEKKSKEFAATALDILKNVFFALLDIFKGPPEEATGKDAPGLQALGAGGVAGALRGCQIAAVKDGSSKDAADVCDTSASSEGTLLLFLTHFGDFNSWEVAQQVRTAMSEGRTGSAKVVLVGIGSVESGREFAKQLELPDNLELYADALGSCHKALGFSTGALPQYKESLNPYFRVFLMLLGVGSPGTIRTVLGGYFGDTSMPKEQTSWVDEALKQGARQGRFPTSVPRRLPWEDKPKDGGDYAELATAGSTVWDGRGFGETGLRPFELATVRLQNMVGGIIANWGKLKPDDDELLVQQGGAVVLVGGEARYFFRDKGILTYVPITDALAALKG